ncbi:transglycosylase SLT domain-containing protein [Alkalisalibacterium limincola]|uniref:Transglycosylase SLT domain-containing protein n=1 Tax=Alkalisalibacterium limincola TaxID=2699169 RepID=A0A5C8KYJ3_9GAMM|nr:transglycosylase SLT domain-containing protein [Alkalisalibacterium limincola]TXK65896.1 transglycosylase SLT domain-containing protein [Alkalisalibacterium limincola]
MSTTHRTRAWRTLLAGTLLALLTAGCQTAGPVAPTLPQETQAPPRAAEADTRVAEGERKPRRRRATPRPAAPAPEPLVVAATDVMARLRQQLDDDTCDGGERARHWQRRYAGSPARFATQIEGVLPLLAFVLEEIEARELPGEFAFIPIVESWYRPEAVASGGPAGMWQMIPATARGNGILITEGYDGRFSPLDATHAALDHLADLHERFGDWRLAAMAYNAGEFRIAQAIRSHGSELVASGESRQPTGLASTTYEYISKIKALSCLLAGPGQRRIPLPDSLMVERLAVVDVEEFSGRLDTVARVLDLDEATVRMLNGGYRNGRIDARSPQRLLLPMQAAHGRPELPGLLAEHAAQAVPAPSSVPSATVAAAGGRYTVRPGDTLSVIARRHGLALARLLSLNGLSAQSIIRPGQVLKLEP